LHLPGDEIDRGSSVTASVNNVNVQGMQWTANNGISRAAGVNVTINTVGGTTTLAVGDYVTEWFTNLNAVGAGITARITNVNGARITVNLQGTPTAHVENIPMEIVIPYAALRIGTAGDPLTTAHGNVVVARAGARYVDGVPVPGTGARFNIRENAGAQPGQLVAINPLGAVAIDFDDAVAAAARPTGNAAQINAAVAAWGLPTTVGIVTNPVIATTSVPVTWDLASINFDDAATAAQTLTVSGTAVLPALVTQPDPAISTAVTVTVNVAAPLPVDPSPPPVDIIYDYDYGFDYDIVVPAYDAVDALADDYVYAPAQDIDYDNADGDNE